MSIATAFDLGSDHPNSPSFRGGRNEMSDHERLKLYVDIHLANAKVLNALVSPSVVEVDVRAFREAQEAYEHSQSDLFCLIEDMTLVPAERLGRAVNA